MRGRLRVMATVTAVALVVAGGSGPSGARAGAPVAGSAGIGDPYFPKDGNGGIDVRHYDIRDTYRFSPAHISGTTTLRVRATEALASFHLDLLLRPLSARIDGADVRFTRPDPHEVVVHPAAPIAAGSVFTVTVAYAGNPSTRSYDGEHNWLADDAEVVAMNEPHMAPWWFASNDHPADKATYDIAITTDADKQVIANGEQVSRTTSGTGGTGLPTTTWRMPQPMASYLAFFAAGSYAVAHGTSAAGIPWTTAVSRRITGPLLANDRSVLHMSGAITDWLQRELGPYPFDSTGGVVTALDPGFALENQTRPTYPWIDRATEVHELAHQWFGDSVSLHRWSDVWLNEGFATYMEARYDEAHGGRTTRAWLHAAYRSWDGDRDFWSVRIVGPGARRIWDDAVYQRGAMALAALRVRIGKGDFRRLLRTWVARHRYGNATTGELQRLAEKVSGQRLGGFFHAWLHTRGEPAPTAANGL